MTFACGTVPEDLGLNRKRSEVVRVWQGVSRV